MICYHLFALFDPFSGKQIVSRGGGLVGNFQRFGGVVGGSWGGEEHAACDAVERICGGTRLLSN